MHGYRWLNDASQQFLTHEEGYLPAGVTVDDRVWRIGLRAEEILGLPGYADRFVRCVKKGWFSLSTPIWTNFGTDRGLPISCVVGDTWINTRDGGGKQARDVVVGDEVLTHRGRYRKVSQVIETPSRGDIYRLKVSGRMTDLYLTGDHPVLTNLGWVRTDELDPLLHLVATNRVVEHEGTRHSIDLRPHAPYDVVEEGGRLYKAGSTSVRPDRRVAVVGYCASPHACVDLDDDLGWALGVWFAEGSIGRGKGRKPTFVAITTNDKDEERLADRWLDIMTRKFGINGRRRRSEVIRNGKRNSWSNTYVNSRIVGNLFASFGDGCKDKTIPGWIMRSPRPVLERFLEGLLAGDGSIRKDGRVKLTLANPRLLLQVYQIGLILGRSMSLQMQDKPGKAATTTHVYTIVFRPEELSLSRSSGRSAIPFADGLAYAPIRTIEATGRVETVYDFTVEEDHSFSAAGVVLHNCFGSHISDSTESILATHAEVGMMTKHGGGTSAYFGEVRGRGSEIRGNGVSSGSVSFMQLFDVEMRVISQGSTRRGNFAAYLPIDHPDIMEFLAIKSDGHPIQGIFFGVCVPDAWMEAMIAGDEAKRAVWARVLQARSETGMPYILFTDNAMWGAPEVYRDLRKPILHSNLCSEIMLPDSEEESFVCDLSSMNVRYFDEWDGTDAVEILVYLLDAVMTEFVEKASLIPGLARAVRFAERHRALGLGWLGWHGYLQSKMIPFESMEAKYANVRVARSIRDSAEFASASLAAHLGEPELMRGRGRRNTTLTAIAPTTSSSFILGQESKSIEPFKANVCVHDLARGKYTWWNPHLMKLLAEKGQDGRDVLDSILERGGSVQHLAFLTDHERAVFKTFQEISQREVVIQAAQRQPYVDQGQSLNLLVPPGTHPRDVNALLVEGWRLGIKSFYYQHGVNAAQAFARDILSCSSCES